jgi:tetratricopeptide (TPR) repeat protein
MAHRPPDRYGSALELARDMERYLAGAPVSAYREPLLVRVGRWCKRHRRALGRSLAAAAALALALVGVALVRDAWAREEAARQKAAEDVRQAQDQEEAARRDADRSRRRVQVGVDQKEFRRLAEERQFRAAITTPAGQSAPYYDARRAQAAADRAAALGERLLGETEQLGLADERAALGRELHDLLLLTAHARGQAAPGPEAARAALLLLDRAAALREAPPTAHRLRARCYRALGEDGRADEAEGRALAVPPGALDHFLQAEECRARAESPAETSWDGLAWRPNPELLRQAVARYQDALRLEPANFWCHLQLGRCYLTLRQGPEALEALGTCVALRPDAPWGYSARGLVGHYADGAADLKRALEIDPEFRPARLQRGVLALLQGQEDQALDDFAAVLEPPEDRRLVEAAYYRGQLRLRRKEYAEALKDFDRVAKENPDFRALYLSRAQAHFLRGDDDGGRVDLTTFLNLGRLRPLAPRDPELLAQRGRLLLQLVPRWGLPPDEYKARLRLTWDELEAARRLGHRPAELFDDLGSVAQLLGEPEQALAAYEQALATAAPDLAVRVRTKRGWIAVLSLRRPEYDRAREEFAAAIRLGPGHADAHAGLGYVLALQKSPGEAQREAAEALCHGADDYVILHNVACVYAQLSLVEKGQARLHQDVAMDVLRRAVASCRRAGDGDAELQNIQLDPSLRVLDGRPDLRKLLNGEGQ